jgi:hypothetical protein
LAQEPVIFFVAKQNGWQTIGVPSDKAKVIIKKVHLWKIQPNYKTSLLT